MSAPKDKKAQIGRTFLIQPFDLMLHDTPQGLSALQGRFAGWVSGLDGPARFACFQVPATLNEKITQINRTARDTEDEQRRRLLMEYRRFYEGLQDNAEYQRSVCGMLLWSEEMPRALGEGMRTAFDTPVVEAPWPPLFHGDYRAVESPFWHMQPEGRPGGRPVWAVLSSYEFQPATWDFGRPLSYLLKMNFPLAMVVDIPITLHRNEAVEKVETSIQAYTSHLSTHVGEDSRSVQRIVDCRRTIQELNGNDALHEVQLFIAVSAPDTHTLKQRIQTIRAETRSWFALRQEEGELLSKAVHMFAPYRTDEIKLPNTRHPVTSRELALMLTPLGYPKLAEVRGIMRGEARGGRLPGLF